MNEHDSTQNGRAPLELAACELIRKFELYLRRVLDIEVRPRIDVERRVRP